MPIFLNHKLFSDAININTKIASLVKSAPDKKASSIVYGLHFLQVWPSLNIAYELLRQVQTDVCIKRISKYNWKEHLNNCRSGASEGTTLYNRTIKRFSDCQAGRFWRNFQLHIIRVRSVSFANFDSIFFTNDLKFNFNGGLWSKFFWYDQRFSR